jgi:dihydrodipicolinate synthase/N-acetylneuraminate lyase
VLRRLVTFQIDEGIHRLIALGSAGEFLGVMTDER